jgi:thiamine biosynthesis lipoprotein
MLLGILAGFGCRSRPAWREKTFFVFDTACEVELYAGPAEFRAAEKTIVSVFTEVQASFSPDSDDLSSPLVLDLFRLSRQLDRDSNGAFDITVKPLSRLWGFLNNNSSYVPTPEQVSKALRHVGPDKITDQGSRLVLEAGAGLDWGGIAKGLAVDRAARALCSEGITRGCVNAGGNVFCWGANPEGGRWKVGVKHPRLQGFLGVLSLRDCGAATSGDYQRYFETGGVRYHHLLDPKTGYPARGKRSVTIVGPRAVICDGLSTAVFVCSDPAAVMSRYPDYGAILVDDQGRTTFLGRRYPFEPSE